MKDMRNLMQQAQQMQEKMKQAQEEIQSLEIQGESGAGMVQVTMNGRHDVSRVKIDPELQSDDLEMLEDLVAAAINDAVRKVEAETKDKMGSVTGSMQIPAGFDFKL